ncbi:hypothetical protein M8C21_019280, partial [Ambrosia artemisiifolia]
LLSQHTTNNYRSPDSPPLASVTTSYTSYFKVLPWMTVTMKPLPSSPDGVPGFRRQFLDLELAFSLRISDRAKEAIQGIIALEC